MLPSPGTYEDLAHAVGVLTQIIERLDPTLKHMADALAKWEEQRQSMLARVDELAECCLFLTEATQFARMGEARARAELEHLRSLVDESEIRRQHAQRDTPPDGVRISTLPPNRRDG